MAAGGDSVLAADELVTYTVDIANSGTAPAYDTVLQDVIPVGMRNGTATITMVSVQLLLGGVLPNLVPTILVAASLRVGGAILTESFLSYLGLGAQPPSAEWGAMLSDAQLYLSIHPLMSIVPGVTITLAVLGFNLLGDGLRDVLDPTAR